MILLQLCNACCSCFIWLELACCSTMLCKLSEGGGKVLVVHELPCSGGASLRGLHLHAHLDPRSMATVCGVIKVFQERAGRIP